jgi:glycosyltransferase involved in cell wall biosynthesis
MKRNYLVISPVKDEEKYIERTLNSMVAQTHKPVAWFIVDDGSSDRSAEIVSAYARQHEFIRLVDNPRRGLRRTGIAEVLAFNAGLEQARTVDFDCIVKLDGDLSFDADYFERLIQEFSANPKLGIASGIYAEDRGSGWCDVPMPAYHAAGASKVVRSECFDAIGGFIAERGWDTVDEIRAMARGWETMHIRELRMKHWKPEGSGMGMLHTCAMHGEIYRRTGGGLAFFLAKMLNRLRRPPIVLGSTAMACGYIRALITRRKPLVTPEEARCYRSLLNDRLSRRPRGSAAQAA